MVSPGFAASMARAKSLKPVSGVRPSYALSPVDGLTNQIMFERRETQKERKLSAWRGPRIAAAARQGRSGVILEFICQFTHIEGETG